MWAPAIFVVGTNYRSVKSYMHPPQIDEYWKYFSICSLTCRQIYMTVDFVVMNASVFFSMEVSSHIFGIHCGHKVKFLCCFVCRTASTQCLTQFAVIMSYVSGVRLILGCVDIWSCRNFLFEHSMEVVLCAVEWSDRWIYVKFRFWLKRLFIELILARLFVLFHVSSV